ncbi:MAG: nucleoside recognition domain-containing protein [Anderseniella sp.]
MKLKTMLLKKTLETLNVYWELVRIIVPVAFATQFLVEAGVVDAIAPSLEPVMGVYGLPPELAFAWLTGMLIGVWGAVVVVFTLVPVSQFSIADMTVFSALLLFAHALPIEQRIIQKAGPGFIVTTLLRLAGGMIYAMILHQIFSLSGIFDDPINPAWIPVTEVAGWSGFIIATSKTLLWMLVILVALAWLMDVLKWSGLMDVLKRAISPVFRYAGIHEEASEMVAIGLLLGIFYGGGLLVREAETGNIRPRQIFLSCVFMSFAHSVIEDTLVVVALGADLTSVLFGRILFAILATALVAMVLRFVSDEVFSTFAFNAKSAR